MYQFLNLNDFQFFNCTPPSGEPNSHVWLVSTELHSKAVYKQVFDSLNYTFLTVFKMFHIHTHFLFHKNVSTNIELCFFYIPNYIYL